MKRRKKNDSLLREIKKSRIHGTLESKSLFQHFEDYLNPLMEANEYQLISFEEGIAFKMGLVHDCRTILGTNNKQPESRVMSYSALQLILNLISKQDEDEYVFMYSNYPKMFPFVIIRLKSAVKVLDSLFELLEEDFSILSSDMSCYLSVSNYLSEENNSIKLIAMGDKYCELIAQSDKQVFIN